MQGHWLAGIGIAVNRGRAVDDPRDYGFGREVLPQQAIGRVDGGMGKLKIKIAQGVEECHFKPLANVGINPGFPLVVQRRAISKQGPLVGQRKYGQAANLGRDAHGRACAERFCLQG